MNGLRKTLLAGSLALSALLGFAVTGPAEATTFSFAFSGTGLLGSGEFSSGDTTSPYLLTGVTGTVNGDPITGFSDYAFGDNFLSFPTPPFADLSGISVSTLSLGDWNIYFDDPSSTYFAVSSAENPDGLPDFLHPVEFDVNLIPEPVSLSLFGAGLAGAALLRRRRKKAAQQ